MKICQPHWDALRAAIEREGVDHLVARDGGVAIRQLQDQAEHGVTVANFDPLMAAHNALVAQCIDVAGLAVMVNDGCPLCYLKQEAPKHGDDPAVVDAWIPSVAEFVADKARQLVAAAAEEAGS